MEQKIDLLAEQLKEIHADVRELRRENHAEHIRINSDVANLRERQAGDDQKHKTMGFVASAIIPFIVALFTAGIALARALP